MKTNRAFIERHLPPPYFTLTFALSWGGLLLLIGGPGAILGTSERTDPYVYLAMLVGPAVAGILPAGLVHGRAGLCDLLTRLTRWRVSARWYAVALLTAPLLVTATSFALSLTLPE